MVRLQHSCSQFCILTWLQCSPAGLPLSLMTVYKAVGEDWEH